MQQRYLENNSQETCFGPGFTLLEVIIAMAIMVIAFAAILAVEGGAINASARAKQLNVVAMLAKNQMIDTEYLIEGKTFDEVEKEKEGTFESPYQDFRWKRTVKELQFPKILGGLGKPGGSESKENGAGSSSSGGGDTEMADMITKMITSFFSKALREVTVTVFWKRGKGEQSYALTTFWVDLNYVFKLSE